MEYSFEWDEEKSRENLGKHGISFLEATTVFRDPFAMLTFDPDLSWAESRYILLGFSIEGRLLVVSFTERPPKTRLISARRATRRERRIYEEEN